MANINDADGWAIMHDRSALPPDDDYAVLYLFGPLPSKEVADVIESHLDCSCKRTVVPLFFPAGITMMMSGVLDSHLMPPDGPVH